MPASKPFGIQRIVASGCGPSRTRVAFGNEISLRGMAGCVASQRNAENRSAWCRDAQLVCECTRFGVVAEYGCEIRPNAGWRSGGCVSARA